MKIATQIGSDYFFTKVLTKDNIEMVINDFKNSIPSTSKEEIDWVIELCQAMRGGASCGTNPYKY